jgi:hypothetical protein
MVWRKLWRCDLKNRWCDQNLDGVKQIFKSVINILMVWTKLWRCDLENWWCEQIFYGVIKCWWCDETIFRCEQTSIFWKLCDHTVWCDLCTCFFLMQTLRIMYLYSSGSVTVWFRYSWIIGIICILESSVLHPRRSYDLLDIGFRRPSQISRLLGFPWTSLT